MPESRAAIGRERRRMIQIRSAFEAGVERATSAGSDLTEFYLACAAYIVCSMDRLHFQDQVIHDLLAERIPGDDTEAHRRLAVLDERQNNSRALVEEFQFATDALRTAGRPGCEIFQAAAKHFIDTFNSTMEARRNPFESYTNQLFSDADWVDVAASSEAADEMEANLYNAVRRSAPDGIDPETMEVVYH